MIVRARTASYEQLRTDFRWRVPARFNIGVACADAQPPGALALVALPAGGERQEYTFGELAFLSNRLGNSLRGLGVARGDRVGIVLPQRVETGIAHLALYKLGAVAVPMSVLFGHEALLHRLGDSGARAVITDGRCLERVAALAGELGGLGVLVVDDPVQAPHRSFWQLIAAGSTALDPLPTAADDPALLIYTSGTTGPPKGALHAHRALLGHQPGFQLSHDFFPQEDDVFWTPADWAWIGGLINSLLSAWLHGRPIVGAVRERFEPEWAAHVIREHRVRNVFFPPTALKLMRQAGVAVRPGTVRTVMSGGEVLGEEMLAWGREHLGVTINEIYGQTEANYVVGNSATVWEVKPGSMGRAYPGHAVAVVDEDGTVVPPGEVGQLGVRVPDPVAFLGYWAQPAATSEKIRGNWLRTGDTARADEDGYLWFQGRTDDIISSAGYRIGPEEIEQCLLRHPAVALSAAIGIPDEVRGEAIKAFVRLVDRVDRTDELKREIQDFVRRRLAAYEYPREIEFVDELPLTVTGKIRRSELRRLERERAGGAQKGGGATG